MTKLLMLLFKAPFIINVSIWYRVEQQTLPDEFLLNFYRMLEDMNLKIGTDIPLVLSCDEIKA